MEQVLVLKVVALVEEKQEAKVFPPWVNLDLTIAEFIAKNLEEFKNKDSGHPGECTKERWDAKLNSIIVRLERYATRFDDPELGIAGENFIVTEGQEAMRELADIFPALWV